MSPRNEYPRPDFQRPGLNWLSLNGPWDFLCDDLDKGLGEDWHWRGLPEQAQGPEKPNLKVPIQVPFAFQTPASGIGGRDAHEVLWYERTVPDIRSTEEKEKGNRLLLRFGAVDYETKVWIGGQLVCVHVGGHVPFDVDISDGFREVNGTKGESRLTIRVRDSTSDLSQPRGKQYWKPESEDIFYTPTSGIWQSVWLESVPPMRVGDSSYGTLLQSNSIATGILRAKVAILARPALSNCKVEIKVSLEGVPVSRGEAELPRDKESADLCIDMRLSSGQRQKLLDQAPQSLAAGCNACWRDGLALWSPDHPVLYDINIRVFDSSQRLVDEVKTTTGMRSISWTTGDGTFRLNDEPYFQRLVLDQGYWHDTGLTPPSEESLKRDIELSQKMGFNGCRKHQKQEDPLFLYWADRLGYLVWGEIANAYEFSEDYVRRFDSEWTKSVKRDINHPCVVVWTPVNESWGYPSLKDSAEQRNHIRALYYMTKTLDPTRPVNDNCGWETVITDLITFHDYSDGAELAKTCATMDGILGPKAGRSMFVEPVSRESPVDLRFEPSPGVPVLCTEFGGVNIAPATNSNAGSKDWGYTTASNAEDLLRRIENLVMAIVRGGHCCGFVYTQLTDIEQEVNGLYTIDRREKLSADGVKAIMEAATKVYHGAIADTGK